MELPAVLGLVVLALIDSTSIGTLIIPLFLVLRPGWRARLVLIYLATITVFYFAVGIVLMAGALAVLPAVRSVIAHPAVGWVQLVLGLVLVALSFLIAPKAARNRAIKAGRPIETTPRWQRRLDAAAASPAGMISLALGAGLAELATMLPYLAAIAIISSFGLPALGSGLLLAGYTLVMVLPGLALILVRLAAGRRVNGALDRFGAWAARHTGGSLSWLVAILGVLIAWDAVNRLGLIGALPWSP